MVGIKDATPIFIKQHKKEGVGDFGIVMTGIIASRVISLMVKKLAEKKINQDETRLSILKKEDVLWIIFSVIIAVIIYSTFYEQIQFTSVIIINITLTFAFWF